MAAPYPHMTGHARPEARVTRGKTAQNRLRGSDHFLLRYDPELLTRRRRGFENAWCVDLGYGATPHTTLEWARRLRTVAPRLRVLGVEIAPERVERAQPFADTRTRFRLGGFELPLEPGERVRLVRAFNVLRQYEEPEVAPAWTQIAQQLLPGGLLIDGTSCPLGRTWTACIVRRPERGPEPWQLEALVLGANLRAGFDPELFQTRLPKRFIHRMVPGEPVHEFVTAFKLAAEQTRSFAVWGSRQWFAAAATHLAGQGYDIAMHPRWLKQGWLVWRQPPVPRD